MIQKQKLEGVLTIESTFFVFKIRQEGRGFGIRVYDYDGALLEKESVKGLRQVLEFIQRKDRLHRPS